jgi:hypothetical protein
MAKHRAQTPEPETAQAVGRFDALKLLLFWSYVLIPLGWGITATAKKALLLFN